MPPAAFEPSIAAIERLLTHALGRATIGIGFCCTAILNAGNIHCNKEIHLIYRERDIDMECLIAKLFAFILFYFCFAIFKKYKI